MNENLKIDEIVEYYIYETPEEKDFTVYVSSDFAAALAAYRGGNCIVYEYHTVRYVSEWTSTEVIHRYEWHID
jgi:intein-encoded DNA endonuclease-like protein